MNSAGGAAPTGATAARLRRRGGAECYSRRRRPRAESRSSTAGHRHRSGARKSSRMCSTSARTIATFCSRLPPSSLLHRSPRASRYRWSLSLAPCWVFWRSSWRLFWQRGIIKPSSAIYVTLMGRRDLRGRRHRIHVQTSRLACRCLPVRAGADVMARVPQREAVFRRTLTSLTTTGLEARHRAPARAATEDGVPKATGARADHERWAQGGGICRTTFSLPACRESFENDV